MLFLNTALVTVVASFILHSVYGLLLSMRRDQQALIFHQFPSFAKWAGRFEPNFAWELCSFFSDDHYPWENLLSIGFYRLLSFSRRKAFSETLRSNPVCHRHFLGSLSLDDPTYRSLLNHELIMSPSTFTLLALDRPIRFENVKSSTISLLLEQSVQRGSWGRLPKEEIIKVLKETDEASLQKLSFLWVFMTRKAIIELASEVDVSTLGTILKMELQEAINTKRLIDYALILIRLRSLQVCSSDFEIDLNLFEDSKNFSCFFAELMEYMVPEQSQSLELFCGTLNNFGYGSVYDVVVDAVHRGQESLYFSIDDVALEYMTLLLATCIDKDPEGGDHHINWAIQSIAPFDGKHLSWERVLFQSIDNMDDLLHKYFFDGPKIIYDKAELRNLRDSILMSQRHAKNIKFLTFLANGRHGEFIAFPFFDIIWPQTINYPYVISHWKSASCDFRRPMEIPH